MNAFWEEKENDERGEGLWGVTEAQRERWGERGGGVEEMNEK